jgi:hypothetical protein
MEDLKINVNVQLYYEKLWKKVDIHIKQVNHGCIVLNINYLYWSYIGVSKIPWTTFVFI